jgi:hypothetical protein
MSRESGSAGFIFPGMEKEDSRRIRTPCRCERIVEVEGRGATTKIGEPTSLTCRDGKVVCDYSDSSSPRDVATHPAEEPIDGPWLSRGAVAERALSAASR